MEQTLVTTMTMMSMNTFLMMNPMMVNLDQASENGFNATRKLLIPTILTRKHVENQMHKDLPITTAIGMVTTVKICTGMNVIGKSKTALG